MRDRNHAQRCTSPVLPTSDAGGRKRRCRNIGNRVAGIGGFRCYLHGGPSAPGKPARRLSDTQVEILLNIVVCPRCDAVVHPDSCGHPQGAQFTWTCENDDTGGGVPCFWQGTSRDLVESAYKRAFHPEQPKTTPQDPK